MKPKFLKVLPEKFRSTCDTYISNFQVIAGQLRALVYRCMCPLLIHQHKVSEVKYKEVDDRTVNQYILHTKYLY